MKQSLSLSLNVVWGVWPFTNMGREGFYFFYLSAAVRMYEQSVWTSRKKVESELECASLNVSYGERPHE